MAFRASFTLCFLLAEGFLFGQSSDHVNLRENALSQYEQGRYSEAEASIRRALDSARDGKDERALALDYATLGDVCQAEEHFTEAANAYETAVGILRRRPDQIHALAIVLRNLGAVLSTELRYDEAVAALKEAAKLSQKNKLQDLPLNAEILNSLGVVYFRQGDIRKAETSFIVATQIKAGSNNAPDVAWSNLGSLYQKQGQFAKAEAAYSRSLQLSEARLGDSHSNLSITLGSLGLLYNATARYKEAEPLFLRSIAILDKALLSDGQLMLQALHGLAKTYIGEHEERRAEPLLARAVGIARRRKVQPRDAATVIDLLETYSQVLIDLQNPAEAERVQADARRIRAATTFTIQASQAK